MIEFLRGFVLNIVTLVIFIVLLEILLPSGKVKKFVNLISGFILIIAIINPILGLKDKGIDLKEFQTSSSNFIDKEDIEESSKLLQEKQIKQIVESYRKTLINRIEENAKVVKGVIAVKADVLINEDYNSEAFGEIKRVYLSIDTGENQMIKPVSKIEKVEVDIKEKNQMKEEIRDIDSKLKREIEAKINKALGVQKENMVITRLSK